MRGGKVVRMRVRIRMRVGVRMGEKKMYVMRV